MCYEFVMGIFVADMAIAKAPRRKMGFWPYFKRNLAQCPCFENFSKMSLFLKLGFNKIELYVNF